MWRWTTIENIDVLFVCTGNTCRSPMAEALLRARSSTNGLDLVAGSAGTLGWSERPATPHAVAALAHRSIHIEHTSRRLLTADVHAASLIVAMTREHAYGVHAMAPEAAERVFLFGEVLRLAGQVDRPATQVDQWVAQLHGRRGDARIPGRVAEEIADPAGENLEVYERTAQRLDRLVAELIDRWPRGSGYPAIGR